jgi:hypothetical protein
MLFVQMAPQNKAIIAAEQSRGAQLDVDLVRRYDIDKF